VGRIVALIRDNTTFNEPNLSRYTVVVLVRTGPDGRIVKSEVVTSSGRPTFDEAVMRGIEKMVAVPKDIDGRIPELLLREGMLITVKFNR
jgi:colicin import membrane protein